MDFIFIIILAIFYFTLINKISEINNKLKDIEEYIKKIKVSKGDIEEIKIKVNAIFKNKNIVKVDKEFYDHKKEIKINDNVYQNNEIKTNINKQHSVHNKILENKNSLDEQKFDKEKTIDKNISNEIKSKNISADNLSEKFSLNMRDNSVYKDKKVSENNKSDKDKIVKENEWKCSCGRLNKKEHKFCVACGKKHDLIKKDINKNIDKKLNKSINKNKKINEPESKKERNNIKPKVITSNSYPEKKYDYNVESKIINMLKENFTGFIGSISLIIGIIFLSLYTAVYVGPFIRFLMLIAVSLGISVVSNSISKKEYWKELSKILRSTSAALYLFSTVAAVFVDGIKFVDNLNVGIMLILTGVALNIYTGKSSNNQAFNALHFFLSIVAMYIVMNKMNTDISNSVFILITAIICFISLYKEADKKLNFDTIFIMGVYFIFHMIWYLRSEMYDITIIEKISGLISIIINGSLIILNPYFNKNSFDSENRFKNLLIHISSIIFTFGSLLPYFRSYDHSWKFMLAISVLFYILSKVSIKLRCDRSLYNIDIFISQIFLVFGILVRSFDLSAMNINIVYSFLLLQCMYFAFLFINSGKRFFGLLGVTLTYIFSLLILFRNIWGYNDINRIFVILTVLSLCIFENVIKMKKIHLFNFIMNEKTKNNIYIFSPVIFLSALVLFIRNTHVDLISASFIVASIWIMEYIFKNKFLYRMNSILLFAVGFYYTYKSGFFDFNINSDLKQEFCFYLGLNIIPIILFLKREKYIRFFKENLFLSHLSIFYLGYSYFNQISVFAPGIFWMISSVILLNISMLFKFKKDNFSTSNYSIIYSVLFLVGYIIRHLYIDINSTFYFYNINFNFLSETLFIGIIYYFYYFIKNNSNKDFILFKYKERAFDLIIAWITFIIAYNIPGSYQPICWIATGFILFFTGNRIDQNNLTAYSMFYYLASVIQNSIITNMYISNSTNVLHGIWIKGVLSLILHIIFAIIVYKKNYYSNITFDENSIFYNLKNIYSKHVKYYLFLPLFIFTALFFYNSFDKTILSLLWMIEIMVLYMVSILFGDKYIRKMSMTGLILIILRMVFYDLSQSSVLTRAFVFIGMGIILLIMNTVYSKYKERFNE